MSEADVRLRPARATDADAFLRLWDDAVAWMVDRGQSGQWGTKPPSADPAQRARVYRWTQGTDLTVAESAEGEVVGICLLIPDHPDYVEAIEPPEMYLLLLITSRDHGGRGIGAALIRHAATTAREAGAQILRVDCWAGAPTLVAYYERQGFIRSDTFRVGDWPGVVFELPLV